MKKECIENLEVGLDSEKNERTKRIYRYVSEVARRIDEAIASCGSTPELFKTSIEVQRQKLRDNCEKLMFLDPLSYGKKALELLWRKVYYDSVTAAKKLNESDEEFDKYLFTHIVSGIGQFHNIIIKVQSHTKLKLKELDFDYHNIEDELDLNEKEPSEELQQWGHSTVHFCLIYLGDLSRYQSEIFHTFDPSIAARYYLQAAHFDISSGMPYNQLGNLYMEKNYNLTSVCYYIHCLSCLSPFEGSLGNLNKIFEKNEQIAESLTGHNLSQSEHIQATISKFLSLVEIWYSGKEDSDIPKRCNVIAQDLRIAFDFEKMPLPDINKNFEEYNQALEEEIINPTYLNSNIVHEMVQICIFTMAKIVESDDKRAFAAKAFSLALLSQLLHNFLQQLQKLGFRNPASKYYRKPSFQEIKQEDDDVIEENGLIINDTNLNDIKPEDVKEFNIEIKEKTVEANEKESGIKISNKKVSSKRRRRRRLDSSGSSELSDDTDSSESNDTEKSDSEDDDLDDDIDDQSDSSYPTDSKSDASDNECTDTEMVTNKNILNGNKNGIVHNNNNDIKKEDSKIAKEELVNSDKVPKNYLKSKNGEVALNESEIQNFFRGANFLPSMKLLQDWILKEKDLILSCGESGVPLFQCVVDLLNIIEYYFKRNLESDEFNDMKILQYTRSIAKDLKLEYKNIPLPEDISLRGTQICKFDMNAAEWNILKQYKPAVYEENVIRILNFINFGHQIVKLVPKIRFNRTMQIYYLKKSPNPKLSAKINHKRSREWHNSKKPHVEGGLLRRLGHLWLTAQVQELERGGGEEPTLLVVDAHALSAHLHHIRHIHASKAFMFLVPTVVLQELDDMKREELSAREAIRWLEAQLQRGSRFLRAQKPGQSRPLPLLKYPKKLPTQAQNFIQILEFCYHFVADEKQGQGDADSKPMLVLLTGQDKQTMEDPSKDFSMTGAAQSAGISLEHVNAFYTKWRQSVKSGKKR